MDVSRKVPITCPSETVKPCHATLTGTGKTTLILNLIPQLPADYRLALLKNEFGDVAIDSELASKEAISGVREMLNGCICCNLVGQLSDALESLRREVNPDRIVVETSGSAFPATLAMEVNRLARETNAYVLDGVMSVIDVENWMGYEDTSVTAKLQARYTDLLVLNKHELVSEAQLERCVDRILDLELDVPTPRILSRQGFVDKDVVFGLDSRLASMFASSFAEPEGEPHGGGHRSHRSEVGVISVTVTDPDARDAAVDLVQLSRFLEEAPRDEVYRIKGVMLLAEVPASSEGDRALSPQGLPCRYVLNWAFGRWTFTAVPEARQTEGDRPPPLRMTVMTSGGESGRWSRKIQQERLVALADPATGDLRVEVVS